MTALVPVVQEQAQEQLSPARQRFPGSAMGAQGMQPRILEQAPALM